MRAHRWRTNRWRLVAEAVETIRLGSFPGASDAVAAVIERRLRTVAELAENVDRHGSSVDAMLCDTIRRELSGYLRAQREAWGAVLLVRWPISLPARLRLAAGLTEIEWAQVAVQDPRRLTAIRRDRFVADLLVGPSVATLILAGRLAGESRRESSPTGGLVLPDL